MQSFIIYIISVSDDHRVDAWLKMGSRFALQKNKQTNKQTNKKMLEIIKNRKTDRTVGGLNC